jgi:uncharacterized GH25 family protein
LKEKRIMGRLSSAVAAAALMAAASPLYAHDMWTDAASPEPGKPLRLVVGYGHKFPEPEAIPAEELPFFKVKLAGPQGEIPLTQGAPNYNWVSDTPVEAGSYLGISDVDPIFWSMTPDGWAMKPKNEAKGATSCGHYIENAKGILDVGAPGNTPLVTGPAGLPIEIVPGAHPSAAKAGAALPLTVLFGGKPLRGAEVSARYAGFDKLAGSSDSKAFTGVTDTSGKLNFVPLVAGEWIISVRNEEPYKDLAACDKTVYGTSLHFRIK